MASLPVPRIKLTNSRFAEANWVEYVVLFLVVVALVLALNH